MPSETGFEPVQRGLVGRDAELAKAERWLLAGESLALLFMHGPGGIGKSTVTVELGRRARSRGRPLLTLDARDVPPTAEALGDALCDAPHLERPLIVIDSFELIESSAVYLRERLLPALPEGSAMCVAGRNPPDRRWFEGRWSDVVEEIRLGPLNDAAAVEVLAVHGIEGESAERIAGWSRGHPLALGLAARLAREDADWRPGEEAPPEELVRALVRRLGEGDISAGHLPTLGVAAIARSTTPALLAAALPEHDSGSEWEWLATRNFVEPLGEGVALHALLRDSVRADLRRRDPLLQRNLKRRIADHVYAAAESTGELTRVLDLSHLIENPGLGWFRSETSARYYVDHPRPGDAAEIDRILDEPGVEPLGGGKAAWRLSRPFFERMPELGVVAKDGSGRIAGFTFVPTSAVDAPELEQMPLVGACLRHARQLEPRGEAVIMPYMCDLSGDLTSGIIGMLANAALLRSSRSNPRYTYMTIPRDLEFGRVFAEMAGAVRVPDVDTEVAGEAVDGWLIDFGPGGFLANQREVVYRELGLEPPARPPERVSSIYAEQVRDALRNLDRPTELAASPLAQGDGLEEQAQSVRELLFAAVEAAFGSQPSERLLHDVIVRGYLDPAPSHEAAAEELYLSRTAYFRRLKQAVGRVAEYLSRQA